MPLSNYWKKIKEGIYELDILKYFDIDCIEPSVVNRGDVGGGSD